MTSGATTPPGSQLSTTASSSDDTAAPTTPEPTDQWRAAVDRYRETAKWAIGAFGAIGALLAGTAPLASIGGLDAERLPAVLAGGTLGLFGVGSAIIATVAMLVPRTAYWHEIRGENQNWFQHKFVGLGPLEQVLHDHPDSLLPPGVASPSALQAGIANLRASVLQAVEEHDAATTPEQREQWESAANNYRAVLDDYENNRLELMRIARFEKARTASRVAFAAMVLGSLIAGSGLGLLLYGVSDQAAAKKTEAEVSKIRAEDAKTQAEARKIGAEAAQLESDLSTATTTAPARSIVAGSPVEVTLMFTAEGKRKIGDALGSACDLSGVAAIAVAGDSNTGSWDVISLPSDGCLSQRMKVSPKEALVTSG